MNGIRIGFDLGSNGGTEGESSSIQSADENKNASSTLSRGPLFKARDKWKEFCSSSTIHGTYFWSESHSLVVKLVWMIVVMAGIASAIFTINSSFEGWKKNPVITSVFQRPIESVPFLAITICPMDDTRFGHVEKVINEAHSSRRKEESPKVWKIVIELLKRIHSTRKVPNDDDCLIEVCTKAQNDGGNTTTSSDDEEEEEEDSGDKACDLGCPLSKKFLHFHRDAMSNFSSMTSKPRPGWIESLLKEQILLAITKDRGHRDRLKRSGICSTGELYSECQVLVKHFRFLDDVLRFLPEERQPQMFNSGRPGTLLGMLYSMLEETPEEQKAVFENFIPQDSFPELYGCKAESGINRPLPDLVRTAAPWGWKETGSNDAGCVLGDLDFGKDIIYKMRNSLHPPHLFDSFKRPVPKAAFPYCWYDSHPHPEDEKMGWAAKYYPNDTFCSVFQTTFNEHGLCYTYNNHNLGFESDSDNSNNSSRFFTIRPVTGCGKERGFQMVVDNNRLMRLLAGEAGMAGRGFKVFITPPGSVTSKVPFVIDPSFHGEHSFFLHGIHRIKTSKEFVEWNKVNKVCHFSHTKDKILDYFSQYSQDNCLLECRLNKISSYCKCSPWYVNHRNLSVCGPEGNRCIQEKLRTYNDELEDRERCGCLNDCEMVHFFATMIRESYEMHKEMTPEKWYDPEKQTGLLANYLLDPENVFVDTLSKRILMLAHNVTEYRKLAARRFRLDIAVLNFFFDTPIITEITLELRTNVFDMISAIGGTLGLFTGVSLITFVEIIYWLVRFGFDAFNNFKSRSLSQVDSSSSLIKNGSSHKSRLNEKAATDKGRNSQIAGLKFPPTFKVSFLK